MNKRKFRPFLAVSLLVIILAVRIDAARPFGLVLSPRWSRPALLASGDTLDVVCRLSTDPEDWRVRLKTDNSVVPLNQISAVRRPGTDLWDLSTLISSDCPPGFYNIAVTTPALTGFMPNACLVQNFPEEFFFAHLTDLHLTADDSASVVRIRRLVGEINRIRPRFVLLTGDLVTRGSPKSGGLIPQIQDLLLELTVPVFITIGNHDCAFRPMRLAWTSYVAPFIDRPTDDYSFDYGPVHFAALDAYVNFDGFMADIYPKGYGPTFNPEQLSWLQADLADVPDSLHKVIFYHYDYHDRLLPILDRHGVDMVVYGHSSRKGGPLIGTTPTLNVNGPHGTHYRLIRVSQDKLIPGPIISLDPDKRSSQTPPANQRRYASSPQKGGKDRFQTGSGDLSAMRPAICN